MPPRRAHVRLLALLCLLNLAPAAGAAADNAGDRKRAQLVNVRRVAVVPPYFATDTISRAAVPGRDKPEDIDAASADPESRTRQYAQMLRLIEQFARTRLPARVAARTPFQVIPEDAIERALKTEGLTPVALFQNGGRLKSGHFPLPDARAVRRLAAVLQVDAVILGTLDEPRKSNGHYTYDPLAGLGYDDPNVNGKAGYFVLLADGTEVLHAYLETLQPVSKGKRSHLLADWMDVEALIIEDLMDELTRYTPTPKQNGSGTGGASARYACTAR
jgi:hypothetical protein